MKRSCAQQHSIVISYLNRSGIYFILAPSLRDPYSRVFRLLSRRFRYDEELALLGIQFGDDEVFELLSERLRDMRKIVLAAVRLNGRDLAFASVRLRDDYEVVMFAVINSRGRALEIASLHLKDEYRIVKKAYDLDHRNLRFASERLQILLGAAA